MSDRVDLECPSCRRKLSVKVDDLRPGRKVKCSHCHSEVTFAGADIAKVLKALGLK